VILTCCLGGISFFSFLGLVLDVCFVGAMIAVAVMTRHGADSCSGYVRTPLGDGQSTASTGGFDNHITYSVHLHTACRLNTAAFAVSIIAAFLFLITAFMQVALVRRHKKEKRYGPSPSNNYTSGYGKRRGLFGRKNKNATAKDAELGATGSAVGAGGLAAPGVDTRPSHDTAYTGSTMGGAGVASDKVDGHGNHAPHGTHGGYYTQPQGTGVNPYGYQNTTGTATNY
jgi:hypothetical protein